VKNRVLNRYMNMVTSACTVDAGVGVRFGRVINMLEPPETLIAPRMVLGVVRGARAAARTVDVMPTGTITDHFRRPRRLAAPEIPAPGAAVG